MSRKKPACELNTASLVFNEAERTLLAEELGSWETELVRRIQETPLAEPVSFTWQELNVLTTHVALESLVPKEQENVPALQQLYQRFVATLARHGTRAMPGLEEDARAAMGAGVRLSEQERESLVRVTPLPPPLRQRLAEVPAGTQFLAFTPLQLAQLRRAIEKTLPRAAHPHRKRLQGVLERLGEKP
jgi:hypothetical protein